MLYIVSTPIGNLKDITLRAIEILKEVDLIACEDTRHSRILLKTYGITTPTTSYYQYNRFLKGKYLLNKLINNCDTALISDAGTPGILDPGYQLIDLAIKNNIPVVAIPGPVALINALVVSGKPASKFVFEGFLPNKSFSRRRRLAELEKMQKYTIILYESCHRILATLEDIESIFGDIPIVVSRELTKKFEETLRLNVSGIREQFIKVRPRGEFVVVI